MKYYTLKEIAGEYDICIDRLQSAVREGFLRAGKRGVRYLVSENALQEFVLFKSLKPKTRGREAEIRRFPDCRGYEECLAAAAIGDTDLKCFACPSYAPVKKIFTISDLAGCLALIHTAYSVRGQRPWQRKNARK